MSNATIDEFKSYIRHRFSVSELSQSERGHLVEYTARNMQQFARNAGIDLFTPTAFSRIMAHYENRSNNDLLSSYLSYISEQQALSLNSFRMIYDRFGTRGIILTVNRGTLLEAENTTPISRPDVRFSLAGRDYAYDIQDARLYFRRADLQSLEYYEVAISGTERALFIQSRDRLIGTPLVDTVVRGLEQGVRRASNVTVLRYFLDDEPASAQEPNVAVDVARGLAEEVSVRSQRSHSRDSNRGALTGVMAGFVRAGSQLLAQLNDLSELLERFISHPLEDSVSDAGTAISEFSEALPEIWSLLIEGNVPWREIFSPIMDVAAAVENDNPPLVAERIIILTVAFEVLILDAVDVYRFPQFAREMVGKLRSWRSKLQRVPENAFIETGTERNSPLLDRSTSSESNLGSTPSRAERGTDLTSATASPPSASVVPPQRSRLAMYLTENGRIIVSSRRRLALRSIFGTTIGQAALSGPYRQILGRIKVHWEAALHLRGRTRASAALFRDLGRRLQRRLRLNPSINPNTWIRRRLFNRWRQRFLRKIVNDHNLRLVLDEEFGIVVVPRPGRNGNTLNIRIDFEDGTHRLIGLDIDHATVGHAQSVNAALDSGDWSLLGQTVDIDNLMLMTQRENRNKIEALRRATSELGIDSNTPEGMAVIRRRMSLDEPRRGGTSTDMPVQVRIAEETTNSGASRQSENLEVELEVITQSERGTIR